MNDDDEVTLAWPVRPTCHDHDPQAQTFEPARWQRGREGQRHCSFCHCLHPEDLHKALLAGATLSGSDWKFGWPHKFYVSGVPRVNRGLFDTDPPKDTFKWYNNHLHDLDPVAFSAITDVLMKHTNIRFMRDGDSLAYMAPHAGYQKA